MDQLNKKSHVQKQTDQTRELVYKLGAQVEENLDLSIRAFFQRDFRLADTVIQYEHDVDAMVLRVEELCVHTLALMQPVAFDLRYLIGLLRISKDLERIGDLAAHIAEETHRLTVLPDISIQELDAERLARKTRSMFKRSLDAFVDVNQELARSVLTSYEEMNWMRYEMDKSAGTLLRSNPDYIRQLLKIINVASNLGRIAYLSTDIAEEVVYIATGETPWMLSQLDD